MVEFLNLLLKQNIKKKKLKLEAMNRKRGLSSNDVIKKDTKKTKRAELALKQTIIKIEDLNTNKNGK